jgi:hypothetical protein
VLGDAYLELGRYDRAGEAYDAMMRPKRTSPPLAGGPGSRTCRAIPPARSTTSAGPSRQARPPVSRARASPGPSGSRRRARWHRAA